MPEWWPALVVGWPGPILATMLSAIGVVRGKAASLVAAAILLLPFLFLSFGNPAVSMVRSSPCPAPDVCWSNCARRHTNRLAGGTAARSRTSIYCRASLHQLGCGTRAVRLTIGTNPLAPINLQFRRSPADAGLFAFLASRSTASSSTPASSQSSCARWRCRTSFLAMPYTVRWWFSPR